MKTGQFVLLLFCCFIYLPAVAQIVEQPDPLRPSSPTPTVADSTKAKTPTDSSTAGTAAQGETKAQQAAPITPTYRYRFSADGTITAGNVNRALLQIASALDYELSDYFKFSSNPSFVYGKQNAVLAEREWFGDFRTTFRHEKRLYYLAFGSFERSNLRQINRRWTLAGGAGYKLLNRKRAYISITNVFLHESTDFVELNDIAVFRNSTRLFGEYSFDNDRWTITHTAFYQPALGTYNVRWNGSVSLQVKLTATTSMRSTLANAYESVVVPGRKNNDLRFTLGLVYEKK